MTSEDIKTRNKLALLANLDILKRDIKDGKLDDFTFSFNASSKKNEKKKVRMDLTFKSEEEIELERRYIQL